MIGWLRGAVPMDEVARLRAVMPSGAGARAGPDLADAIRNSALVPAVRHVAPEHRPVRIVAFHKSSRAGEGRNWGLPWHQDRVIAVAGREDGAPVANWSCKAGTWHCEPGVDVLRSMLFVRLHLDGTTAATGGMEYALPAPDGLVPSEGATDRAEASEIRVEDADPGDALVLPMLTLHRSRPATVPARRRVIRVDFAAGAPPAPLRWVI